MQSCCQQHKVLFKNIQRISRYQRASAIWKSFCLSPEVTEFCVRVWFTSCLNLLQNAEREPECCLKNLTVFHLRSGFFLWGQGRVEWAFDTWYLAFWLVDRSISYLQKNCDCDCTFVPLRPWPLWRMTSHSKNLRNDHSFQSLPKVPEFSTSPQIWQVVQLFVSLGKTGGGVKFAPVVLDALRQSENYTNVTLKMFWILLEDCICAAINKDYGKSSPSAVLTVLTNPINSTWGVQVPRYPIFFLGNGSR